MFRTHGCRNGTDAEPDVAPCVNVQRTCAGNEVWSYGNDTQAILEKYVRVRAALKPYIAALAANVTAFGAPTMRPLALEFPADPATAGINDQCVALSSLAVVCRCRLPPPSSLRVAEEEEGVVAVVVVVAVAVVAVLPSSRTASTARTNPAAWPPALAARTCVCVCAHRFAFAPGDRDALPSNTETQRTEHRYMLGPELLVAPVTVQNATSRSVYFPAGATWQHFFDPATKVAGGQRLVVDAPLDTIPVYRRI